MLGRLLAAGRAGSAGLVRLVGTACQVISTAPSPGICSAFGRQALVCSLSSACLVLWLLAKEGYSIPNWRKMRPRDQCYRNAVFTFYATSGPPVRPVKPKQQTLCIPIIHHHVIPAIFTSAVLATVAVKCCVGRVICAGYGPLFLANLEDRVFPRKTVPSSNQLRALSLHYCTVQRWNGMSRAHLAAATSSSAVPRSSKSGLPIWDNNILVVNSKQT